MFRPTAIFGLWIPVLLLAIAVLVGLGATKMRDALPDWTPVAAFGLAGFLLVVGIGLGIYAAWRMQRERERSSPATQAFVTSYDQRGGITAREVNIRDGDGRSGR